MKVLASIKWIKEVQHRSKCYGIMRLLASDMLAEIPENRRAYWRSRLGGVDNAARALYDAHKVNKPNNETTPTHLPAVPPQPPGADKETLMGDEEE